MATSTSFASQALGQQQLILDSMNQAATSSRPFELESKLQTTASILETATTTAYKINDLACTALKVATAKHTMSTKEANTFDFGTLRIEPHLEGGVFSSQKRAYLKAIDKLRSLQQQIPDLDLTYFSIAYSSPSIRSEISKGADDLDFALPRNRDLTCKEVSRLANALSTRIAKLLVIVGKATALEIQNATQKPEFAIDNRLLDLIITAKKNAFTDKALIQELTTLIRTQEEFIAVFINLFSTKNAQAFGRLFTTLYELNLQDLTRDSHPTFTHTFLLNFSRLISNKVIGNETGLLHAERRAVVQECINREISSYRKSAEVARFQLEFIENNEAYFLNELGGFSFKKDFLRRAIETLANGFIPSRDELKTFTVQNFQALILLSNTTNHAMRLQKLLPEELVTRFVDLHATLLEMAQKIEILAQAIEGYKKIDVAVITAQQAEEDAHWMAYLQYHFPEEQLTEASANAAEGIASNEEVLSLHSAAINEVEGEEVSSDDDWSDEEEELPPPTPRTAQSYFASSFQGIIANTNNR